LEDKQEAATQKDPVTSSGFPLAETKEMNTEHVRAHTSRYLCIQDLFWQNFTGKDMRHARGNSWYAVVRKRGPRTLLPGTLMIP
jgi:hypothetical protein